MDTLSMPFTATYGSTGLEAFGDDRLKVSGGSVIIIGGAPAAVEVRGIVRLTRDALEIEYRATQAQVFGIVQSPDDTELKSVSIPLAAVDSIRVKRGIFRKPRLIIEFNRLDLVPAIPWSETTRLELSVERRERQRAREFCISTQLTLADAHLERLGGS